MRGGEQRVPGLVAREVLVLVRQVSPLVGSRANSTCTPWARSCAIALTIRSICSAAVFNSSSGVGSPGVADEVLAARCCARARGIPGRRNLRPQVGVAIWLIDRQLRTSVNQCLPGRSGQAWRFEHRGQRKIRIIESEIRLDQVHRQPLTDALRRGFLVGVRSRPSPNPPPVKNRSGATPISKRPVNLRVRGQILDRSQRARCPRTTAGSAPCRPGAPTPATARRSAGARIPAARSRCLRRHRCAGAGSPTTRSCCASSVSPRTARQ